MSQILQPFIPDMTETSLLMHFSFQMCLFGRRQTFCSHRRKFVTVAIWLSLGASPHSPSLDFLFLLLYMGYTYVNISKSIMGEIKAIFLGDFNAQPVMKPWADHDIEWGHSNSGHFVVNESTDDGEFNQNVGRCSTILPMNLLKEEKTCLTQTLFSQRGESLPYTGFHVG